MDKCRDTVLITGLKGDLSGQEFIKAFSDYGVIKTHRETAQRLAEMKIVKDRSEKEGIITYEDQRSAAEAIRKLNGTKLDGKEIYVKTADNYFYGRMPDDLKVPTEYGNLAWRLWKEEGLRESGGGRGGKGAENSSFFATFPLTSWMYGKPGHAGQPGQPGPGGEGGQGGKPANA